MTQNPLVSVIVPTKNSSQTLGACLESIQNQTYKNIELIVVDNFSTDDTQKIAKTYTNHVYSQGPERSTQRNVGAQKATGEYFVFIDSDMELSKEVIGSCVEVVQKDLNIKGVIIPEESFGEGFWAQCKKLERSFYVGVPWMEAARFIKKETFDSVKGYNERMVSGEDWDLSQRVGRTGKIGRIHDFIYHNEGHPKFFQSIKKKYYYARLFKFYKAENKDEPNIANQTSIIKRYALFFSVPNLIYTQPFLFAGMLLMKTGEFAFGGFGYIFGKAISPIDVTVKEIHTEDLPSISFILPTYNAEKYLKLCLDSIVMQDYPKDRVEILLIDGGSKDRTLEIAKEYPVKVFSKPKIVAEYAKTIGINESKGEYFILVDSDNEIVEQDWLQKMVRPMLEHPELFGVESPLSHDKSLSSLNRYFARMRIADPLAKYLASKPINIKKYNGYDILEFGKDAALITGANGFLWSKHLTLQFKDFWKDKFEEANFATYIHEKTGANYSIPHSASVRHFYCESLKDFIEQRKKIANKMKMRIKNKEYVWLHKQKLFKIFYTASYLISIVGPLVEACGKNIKQKTTDFIWHPLISLITIGVYIKKIYE